MADSYDVVIIGGGPGGYNCAIRCGQLGLSVACVESRATLGGTCLNVGCIPSKALLHASELYEEAKDRFASYGIGFDGLSLDLPQMMAQKQDAVDGLTKGVAFLFKKNKVDWISGRGRIAGPGRVQVTGADGERTLGAKHIVIAAGSDVAPLPGVEIDEKRIVSSTGALALDRVPGRMVVVGAGVIGLELGSVWRRLGAQVTVVEYLDRILPGADAEAARSAQKLFRKQGMDFRLGTKVEGVDAAGEALTVRISPAQGGDAETIETDIVLAAIGRRPATRDLGLESVGVTTDKRGVIQTDDHLRVADNVWAIGDCAPGPMLAHKAEEEGVAVAERIAAKPGHVDYNVIPSVVYTSPEIAWVGATEEGLKESGRAYRVGNFPMIANSRARTNHTTDGFVKILADAATDEILGVHIVATGAGELIAEATLAMAFGASSEDIARTCHAHPTMSEAVRQAAMGVEGWTMQA
jgi:dihydrolipoamide dehydrogenase